MFDKGVLLYINWVIKHPRLVLFLILLMTIGLTLGLPNFKLDASADSLTLEHDTDLDYFREISKRYQSGDFLVVTFKPKGELFEDPALATLKALRDDLTKVNGVTNVMSMLDVPLLYSPPIKLTDIGQPPRTLMQNDTDRSLARDEFLHSPIYRDMLLGPDGQTTALLVNLKVDNRYIELVRQRDHLRLKQSNEGLTPDEQAELAQVAKTFLDYRTHAAADAHARVADVRAILAGYKDRADVFLGGATMITSDMIDYIRSDLVVFGLAILAFIIVMMAAIFRQVRFVVLPIITCLTSVMMMLGYLSWIDWRLTVISSNFVALLLIINLAITIHLVVRFREFQHENPEWSRAELVKQTVIFMARPCLYTILTTMVAFASLVVSDIRPVIDFGWMMTIGLGLALLLSFAILPAGLLLWPSQRRVEIKDNSAAMTLRFSHFTEKHGRAVFWVSVSAAVVSIYGMTKLEVENRFIDYFHESTEIYQGMSVIDKYLGGTIGLDIILDHTEDAAADLTAGITSDEYGADEGDPFAGAAMEVDPFSDDPFATDADAAAAPTKDSYWFTLNGLQQVEGLHDYLESIPEIGKVQSLAVAYKVAKDINGAKLNDFELAVMKKSLPPDIQAVLVDPYLSDDQTRITLRVKETDPNLRRMELVDKIRQFMVTEGGFSPEQIHFTGLLVMYNNMLQSLFSSQIITLGAVFFGIMLMFIILFRSVILAVIAILPNLLAASVVLGGMGLAGVPLDMMTITIAAITVGIGVDDTIHYIHRFQKEFVIDRNYIATMHRSHASIGLAMYYTSLTIVVGFSILALSQFIPSIYFGLLTASAMVAAIVAALTLLPKLILLIKPLGPEATA